MQDSGWHEPTIRVGREKGNKRMNAFAMRFGLFAFTMLFFTLFGVAAIIVAVLLFAVLPMARQSGRRHLLSQDNSVPTYERKGASR